MPSGTSASACPGAAIPPPEPPHPRGVKAKPNAKVKPMDNASFVMLEVMVMFSANDVIRTACERRATRLEQEHSSGLLFCVPIINNEWLCCEHRKQPRVEPCSSAPVLCHARGS